MVLLLSRDCSTLTLDSYLIMLSVKQEGIKYHFLSFGMTQSGIEPQSPRPLANTLNAWPMDRSYKNGIKITIV